MGQMETRSCRWPEFLGESLLDNEVNPEENGVTIGGRGEDGVLMTSLEHLDPAVPEADAF